MVHVQKLFVCLFVCLFPPSCPPLSSCCLFKTKQTNPLKWLLREGGRRIPYVSVELFVHSLLIILFGDVSLFVSSYLFSSEYFISEYLKSHLTLFTCLIADPCKRAQQWKCRYQQWRWGDRLEEQVLLNVLLYHQSPSTAPFFSLQNKPLCPFLTLNQFCSSS